MRHIISMLAFVSCLHAPVSVSARGPAIINIDGEIDETTVSAVQDQVAQAIENKSPSLLVRINSPGGGVFAGFEIISVIRHANIPSVCEVERVAASMAFVILQSDACGTRVVHADSILMTHSVSGAAKGKARDIENALAIMQALNRANAAIICQRTGWSIETYLHLVVDESRDLFWVGEEALKVHAADKVVPINDPAK